MTTMSLHTTPRTGSVMREQIRATTVGLRTEALMIGGGLAVLSLLALGALIRNPPHGHAGSGPMYITAAPMVLIALFIPFAVWRNEAPARRAYHWSMPVSRSTHTLARLGAGWVWMMATVLVYMLLALSFVVGVSLTYDSQVRVFDEPWTLLVPFVAATVAYLLTSTAAIASDHPWRWIGGIVVAYIVAAIFADSLHIEWLRSLASSIAEGDYGLSSGVFGEISDKHHALDVGRWRALQQCGAR